MRKYLFVILTHSVLFSEAFKILAVFPVPSISHQVVFRPLTRELAKRGHEVTVVTPDPAFKKEDCPKNLIEIDVHDISYNIWIPNFINSANNKDSNTQLKIILDSMMNIFKQQLQTDEFQDLIKNKTDYFDLLLIEANCRATVGLSHIFKVPVIAISSFGFMFNYDMFGVSTHPYLYPPVFHQKTYNLSLWDKVTELYKYYKMEKLWEDHDPLNDAMLRSVFGPDTPSLTELRKNIDMLFLNIHTVWDSNRPVPPNVIYVGALHQNPVKPLSKDLEEYLNSSTNGVIYVSFGTNVVSSNLPNKTIEMFLKVFSQLPYNVLLKWDEDVLPRRADNIKISKWFPQSDLLRHPNVKLFITQGGLQSTDEAISAAVPLIGFPLIVDQWFNVDKYVHHKIGIKLDIETVTEKEFRDAIYTIIEDKTYHRNILKLRSLMLDQPQSSLERAVWWTERVLRHGGAKDLRTPAANMSWTEYLELRLVSVLMIMLFSVAFVLTFLIYFVVTYIRKHYSLYVKTKIH